MIDKTDSLTLLHDDNGAFTNYSHKAAQFGKDSVSISLVNAEDYIYIGYKKPINTFYVNISIPDGTEGSLTLEYWNGSTWNEASEISDDTYGLFRSGFIRWERELANHAKSTINSSEMYWYRLTLDQDRDLVIKGLNIIFSDDYELSLEQPYIQESEFLGSELSHIKTHAAAKREIIQRFRNKNYIKYNSVTGLKEDINAWDLLEIEEVKLAATYLALAKIYFQLSDEADDVWNLKSREYEEKFNKYIQIARLSLDVDDNGLTSNTENKPSFITKYMRR